MDVFGTTVRITIDGLHVMENFKDRLNQARHEMDGIITSMGEGSERYEDE